MREHLQHLYPGGHLRLPVTLLCLLLVSLLERGIKDKKMPVLSVSTRKAYVDALLRRKDPLKLVLSRKLTASHKLTLAKWGLPFIDVLLDASLIGKVLSHQPIVEAVISTTLMDLGY